MELMSVGPTQWTHPPERPVLTRDDVHIWRINLEQPPERLEALRRVLAPDESERAARFRFEKDRRHFTVARGALRHLLARYLGVSAEEVRFSYGDYGKPSLADSAEGPHVLRFNLSHSHQLALCGVVRGREIGVDVEHIRPDFATGEIAERFFSRREVASLFGLAPEARAEAFFNCWTRKEAYIKAIGEGLSHPLDTFDVSLAPGEAAALLATRPDPLEAARWSLQALWPGAGYAGAVAVEGRDLQFHYWHWA